jgi:two-component system nitrate/nitrite response regulator NarL
MNIRIVLVDDHSVVLLGLVQLFSRERDFEVVATASNGEAALSAIRKHLPDVVVLDLRMPGKDGLAVLEEMKRESLHTKAVVLTAGGNDDGLAAIRLGARGLVLKEMTSLQLVECVRVVHSGSSWIDKSVARRTASELLQGESGMPVIEDRLTLREIQVARMIADGIPTKVVADKLAISEGTAKLHLHHVYTKLHVRGRVALLRYIQIHGLR